MPRHREPLCTPKAAHASTEGFPWAGQAAVTHGGSCGDGDPFHPELPGHLALLWSPMRLTDARSSARTQITRASQQACIALNPGLACTTTEMRGGSFISLRHRPAQALSFSPSSPARAALPGAAAGGTPRPSPAPLAGSRRQEAASRPGVVGSRGRCTWEEKHFAGGRKQDLTYKQHPQGLSE